MPKRTKLTNSSDETEISSLISGDCVFTIPYFQRPYRWKPDKLKQLNLDILNIIDSNDSHFLGAIIIHGRRSNPADPNTFDIIDGQQRITTLILYMCAVIKVLCSEKEYDEAASLFLKYLVIARKTPLASNIKIHPCKEDRTQLNLVFEALLKSKEFSKRLDGFKLKMLPSTGKDRGALKNNYNNAVRFVKEQCENEGLDRVREIYTAILEMISIVQIDVWDPTNGPKIFDGLNSRQEPMTIGDLVRNEIFSRVSNEKIADVENIDEHKWQPFYKKFQKENKNLFDSYFFPYGLTQDPNLKKSEVFNFLRDAWEGIKDPGLIIEKLALFQDAFIDLICGTNLQSHEKSIEACFFKLTALGLPSSTYPFLVQLSNAIKDKTVLKADGLAVLTIVESFLVRRAVCGHEPTGLHAVFKRLWTDCKGKPTAASVSIAIRKHKTVAWPNDEEFKVAISNRDLYGSAITPYLLIQYDLSLKGDQPKNNPWIEHVLPEKMSKDWKVNFTKSQHQELKDTLANLIPLSKEMNISVSNNGYMRKQPKYLKDSMFKSARDFAAHYRTWTPTDISNRAKKLVIWAENRWP